MKLPWKLFMTSTLVVLKLSRMPLFVPSFVSLPKLNVLEIRRVMGLDDNNIRILLPGCPTIEELVIEESTMEKTRVIDISIPTLKSFPFSYRFVIDISVDCAYEFVINAPNLDYVHVKGHISDNFVAKSLVTLIDAHLDLRHIAVDADHYNIYHHVRELFKGIANIKLLSLSNDSVQVSYLIVLHCNSVYIERCSLALISY